MHSNNGTLRLLTLLLLTCVSLVLGRALVQPFDSWIREHADLKSSNISRGASLEPIEDHVYPTLNRRGTPKQPKPATDSELAASAAKGCSMLYMLAANADDALARMKTNPKLTDLSTSQSQWDNAKALKQYGWTEKIDSANWAYMGVNDVMKELQIDTGDGKTVNVQLNQDQAVNVDGHSYVASKGSYNQAINVAAGMIIPYYVYSPQHESKVKNIQGEIVPFAKYSDVLFLEYSKLCGRAKPAVPASGLKHFMFLNVENANTWAIALAALMKKNEGKNDIPLWPGTEFSMNSAEGKALLGTQIGAPLAWMLIQHKGAFGKRSIAKARVFRNKGMTNRDTETPYPSLLFYTDDAPENHCEPDDACCCPEA